MAKTFWIADSEHHLASLSTAKQKRSPAIVSAVLSVTNKSVMQVIAVPAGN